MIVNTESNIKYIWLLVLISFICLANARQIRYSRFNKEVVEDGLGNENSTSATHKKIVDDKNEEVAIVQEIKLTPYSAGGFRPSREFPLPNETAAQNGENDMKVELIDELLESTTTTIDLTTTTQGYDSEITTIKNAGDNDLNEDENKDVEGGEDMLTESEKPKAPYPASGIKPKIPFLLPTDNFVKNEQQQPEDEIASLTDKHTKVTIEVKAPYPASGYRPSKAFLLPSEQFQLEKKNNVDTLKNHNSNHPVCGSSTNPLAPKPLNDEKEDPDSESINVNVQNLQKSQRQRSVVIPARYSVHPLLFTRPVIYSAPAPLAW